MDRIAGSSHPSAFNHTAVASQDACLLPSTCAPTDVSPCRRAASKTGGGGEFFINLRHGSGGDGLEVGEKTRGVGEKEGDEVGGIHFEGGGVDGSGVGGGSGGGRCGGGGERDGGLEGGRRDEVGLLSIEELEYLDLGAGEEIEFTLEIQHPC